MKNFDKNCNMLTFQNIDKLSGIAKIISKKVNDDGMPLKKRKKKKKTHIPIL